MKLGLRSLVNLPSFLVVASLALGCGGAGNGNALFASDSGPTGSSADGSSPGTTPSAGDDASAADATVEPGHDGGTSTHDAAGGGDDTGVASGGDAAVEAGDAAGCDPDAGAPCEGKCGELKNECGSTVECGGCDGGLTCGGSGPNVCGTGPCKPSCSGKACGDSDGCGGICSHGTCAQGQACVAGTCTCDPSTCGGCCEGIACRAGTDPGACGKSGSVCQACPSGDTCTGGACKACVPSCSGKACGADDGCGGKCATGTCGSGLHCAGGSCVCDATSCTGCCSATGACLPGTSTSACGLSGAACAPCPSPDTCGGGGQKGVCGCTPSCGGNSCGLADGCGGACSTCPSGQRCSAGACVCDATSCPNGCCAGTTCLANSPETCGTAGGACATCSSQQSCVSGSCINATPLWSPPGGFGFGVPETMLAIDPSGQNLYAIDQNNSTTNMIIYRVPTSGAAATPFASGLDWVVGVAADSSNVYWLSTGDNTVVAQPAAGGSPRVLATGQYFPSNMAVLDSTTVYWSGCNSAGSVCNVWQLPVSGGTPTAVVSGPASAAAVASPNLFLGFGFGVGLIQSFAIASGGQNAEFDSQGQFYGVAATSFDVAWCLSSTSTTAYNGQVKYMPTASLGQPGPSNQPVTLAVGQYPVSIAIDSSYVYWANWDGTHPMAGSIAKAPIGGGSPTTLVSGIEVATIVVGSQYVYWLGFDGAVSGVFRTPK